MTTQTTGNHAQNPAIQGQPAPDLHHSPTASEPQVTTQGFHANAMHQTAQERGLELLRLKPELLLKRVAQGGFSGELLADAFLSAYRPNWTFSFSLFDVNKLDAEGFLLFNQILYIRHFPGWNDDDLFQLGQKVEHLILGGEL